MATKLPTHIPTWAKALIIAEWCEDRSDTMTDYFATHYGKQIALAWSTHTRDHFGEMRKAAATFSETAHLGPGKDVYTVSIVIESNTSGKDWFADNGYTIANGDVARGMQWDHGDGHGNWRRFETRAEAEAFIAAQPALMPCWYGEVKVTYAWFISMQSVEHREKYAMGKGYYLNSAYSFLHGWRVRKIELSYDVHAREAQSMMWAKEYEALQYQINADHSEAIADDIEWCHDEALTLEMMLPPIGALLPHHPDTCKDCIAKELRAGISEAIANLEAGLLVKPSAKILPFA